MLTKLIDVNPNTEVLEEIVQEAPADYFNRVKNSLKALDKVQLQHFLATANKLLDKARQTGQQQLARRLEFKVSAIKVEMYLNSIGYNKYVNRDDVIYYMDKVKHRSVKLAELKDYLREIPDEAVQKIKETEGLFSDYLILFTDYTDEMGKQVAQKEKDKDPILFGVFYDDLFREVNERFYFLHDWVDEYCDLTLDKMVEEYKDLSDEELVKYSNVDFKLEREDLRGMEDEVES